VPFKHHAEHLHHIPKRRFGSRTGGKRPALRRRGSLTSGSRTRDRRVGGRNRAHLEAAILSAWDHYGVDPACGLPWRYGKRKVLAPSITLTRAFTHRAGSFDDVPPSRTLVLPPPSPIRTGPLHLLVDSTASKLAAR